MVINNTLNILKLSTRTTNSVCLSPQSLLRLCSWWTFPVVVYCILFTWILQAERDGGWGAWFP